MDAKEHNHEWAMDRVPCCGTWPSGGAICVVAVKKLSVISTKPIEGRNFLRDVTVPTYLSHPAVLPFIGFCLPHDNIGPIIVTKFIENDTLEAIWQRRMANQRVPGFTDVNRRLPSTASLTRSPSPTVST
jgi:serine/threonine protein kinase